MFKILEKEHEALRLIHMIEKDQIPSPDSLITLLTIFVKLFVFIFVVKYDYFDILYSSKSSTI